MGCESGLYERETKTRPGRGDLGASLTSVALRGAGYARATLCLSRQRGANRRVPTNLRQTGKQQTNLGFGRRKFCEVAIQRLVEQLPQLGAERVQLDSPSRFHCNKTLVRAGCSGVGVRVQALRVSPLLDSRLPVFSFCSSCGTGRHRKTVTAIRSSTSRVSAWSSTSNAPNAISSAA